MSTFVVMRAAVASTLLGCATFWLHIAAPSSVCAQAAASESPTVLFRRGAAAFGDERYIEAAGLFERAYAISHEPSMLYNLGLAQQRAGLEAQAVATYRRYLEASPDAPERSEVETNILTLERLLAAHRVEEEARRARDDEARRIQELEAQRVPQGADPTGSTAETNLAAPNVAPYILLGVGVAGLATSAVLTGLAVDAHDSAVREPVQLTAAELASRANDLGIASTIAWGISGALTVGALVWTIVEIDATPHAEGQLHVSIGPNSLRIEGAF